MDIYKNGTQLPIDGPSDWFSGRVRIDPLFDATEPAKTSGAQVTFEPGARTAWHSHPLGQILIVTQGLGKVQREGQPIQTIHPGDVVRVAPQERHWHGAGPNTAMTHIAIQDAKDGSPVTWQEHVSDTDYFDQGE